MAKLTRVQVAHRAPVEVVVNVETGTVERVVMIDEEVTLERNEEGFAVVHTPGYGPVHDTDLSERAAKIAENSPWPGWEHGF